MEGIAVVQIGTKPPIKAGDVVKVGTKKGQMKQEVFDNYVAAGQIKPSPASDDGGK